MCILREEGSNGDREMAAAAFAAGMEPWDITMSDLINGRATLDTFQVRGEERGAGGGLADHKRQERNNTGDSCVQQARTKKAIKRKKQCHTTLNQPNPTSTPISNILRHPTPPPTASQGIIFVGGFSYADTLDSAKGWAGTIRFNDRLLSQFKAFYNRPDTWSLGICNGCQLMALLGWVPAPGAVQIADVKQPRFVHNASGRFESRWVQVRIEKSPAVLLKGMEGMVAGVWAAHGEGQALFPDDAIKAEVLAKNLIPVK